MVFPDSDLPIRVGAAWGVDPTTDPAGWAYTDLTQWLIREPVTITAGRRPGAREASAGSCALALHDEDQRFMPLHPMSPYWPNVVDGTPLRVSIDSAVTPVVRAVSSATAQGSAVTVTKPAGTVAGDTLLVFHSTDHLRKYMALPPVAGAWTLLASRTLPTTAIGLLTTNVWMRIAGDNEPASYTFGQSVNADGVIVMVAIAGADEPLNANPFFEVDSSGWSGSGATIARSAAQAHEGAASLLITPDGVSGSGGATAGRVAVTAGQIYLASMWMYSPGGWSDLSVAVDWYTAVAGGSYISTSFGPTVVVPAGGWTYTAALVTAPATAAGAALRARHGGTPTAGDIWYADEVKLQAPGLEVTPMSLLAASLQEAAPDISFDTPSLLPISDHDLELRWACGTSTPGVTWTAPAGYTELADLQSTDFTTGCLASKALSSSAATGVQTFTASSGAMENGAGFTVVISSVDVRHSGHVASFTPALVPTTDKPTRMLPVMRLGSAGILRRLGQGAAPLHSPVRRAYTAAGVVAYWPLEDMTEAGQFASAISGHPAAVLGPDMSLSSDDSHPGSGPLPVALTAGGSAVTATIPSSVGSSTRWAFEFFVNVESEPAAARTVAEFYTNGTGATWRITLRSTAGFLGLEVFDPGGTLVDSAEVTAATEFYGGWTHIQLNMSESGGNVSANLTYSPVLPASFSVYIGATVGFAGSVGRPTGWQLFRATVPMSMGHVGVFADRDLRVHWNADYGYITERAGERFLRLCGEEGIPVRVIGDPYDTEPMGRQRIATLLDLVGDIEGADGGILYETRVEPGLTYRTRVSRYNQPARLTVDLSTYRTTQGTSPQVLLPVYDDLSRRNDITVTRLDGSSAHTDDQEHISKHGRYEDEGPPVNVETDARLPDIAAWRRYLGTAEALRYPSMPLDLGANPDLLDDWTQMQVGDRVLRTNPPPEHPPGDIDQIIEGYTETPRSRAWAVAGNHSPNGPWLIGAYAGASDTDPYLARYGVEGSVLHFSAGTADTTLYAQLGDRRWSTDAADFTPYMRLRMGGEEFDVSAIADGPAFVAAGAASHGDNTQLTPAMPAGVQGQDALFVLAAIRNTSANPNTPAGYSLVASASNMRLFRKLAAGSFGQPTTDTAPTVTFSGGAAGDTTSAQIVAFRGARNSLHRASSALTNSSAQDIATPGLTVEEDVCLLLLLAWKQDDWTGVAVPAGWTEIGEPSSTLGSDQGMYWAYQIQSDRQSIQPGNLVVTGGVAAISKSQVVANRGLQIMTVSQRSVNGVVKSHPSGTTEVRLAREARYGL